MRVAPEVPGQRGMRGRTPLVDRGFGVGPWPVWADLAGIKPQRMRGLVSYGTPIGTSSDIPSRAGAVEGLMLLNKLPLVSGSDASVRSTSNLLTIWSSEK